MSNNAVSYWFEDKVFYKITYLLSNPPVNYSQVAMSVSSDSSSTGESYLVRHDSLYSRPDLVLHHFCPYFSYWLHSFSSLFSEKICDLQKENVVSSGLLEQFFQITSITLRKHCLLRMIYAAYQQREDPGVLFIDFKQKNIVLPCFITPDFLKKVLMELGDQKHWTYHHNAVEESQYQISIQGNHAGKILEAINGFSFPAKSGTSGFIAASGRPPGKNKEETFSDSLGKMSFFCIGIDHYIQRSRYPPLKTCVHDATSIYNELLSSQAFTVSKEKSFLLTSKTTDHPSKGVILSQLEDFVQSIEENERLLFYYSGHGDRLEKNGKTEFCLIPQDYHGTGTEIPISDVLEKIERSKAKYKVIVLDACYSGPTLSTEKRAFSNSSLSFISDYIKNVQGISIISSSSSDERSTTESSSQCSLFTHVVLDGLRGAADALDGDFLTISSFFSFVSLKMKEETKSRSLRQRPSISTNATGEMILGDFRYTKKGGDAPIAMKDAANTTKITDIQNKKPLLKQPHQKYDVSIQNKMLETQEESKLERLPQLKTFPLKNEKDIQRILFHVIPNFCVSCEEVFRSLGESFQNCYFFIRFENIFDGDISLSNKIGTKSVPSPDFSEIYRSTVPKNTSEIARFQFSYNFESHKKSLRKPMDMWSNVYFHFERINYRIGFSPPSILTKRGWIYLYNEDPNGDDVEMLVTRLKNQLDQDVQAILNNYQNDPN